MLPSMLDAGLLATVNSDDPAYRQHREHRGRLMAAAKARC